jgi:hypothetical protein
LLPVSDFEIWLDRVWGEYFKVIRELNKKVETEYVDQNIINTHLMETGI